MLEHISAAIDSLRKVLRLRRPGKVYLVIRREDTMLHFVLVLPEHTVKDLQSRLLGFQVGNQEPVTLNLDPTVEETEEYSGEEGDVVTGNLVDVDDAGNRSEPRDFEVTLRDTLAPPQPGEFGVRVTREE